MLITDYNIILTTKDKTYEEKESFLIKDIVSIIRTLKDKGPFILNVRGKPSYYFSSKKSDEAIEMLKALYQNCSKSRLVIYCVPSKEIGNFLTTSEDLEKAQVRCPEDKHKESDIFETDQQRCSNSTNDDSQEETEDKSDKPHSKEETKSEVSEQKFKPEEKNPEIGNKIIEQLGNDYLENQQRILSHGKSTLIFSKKTFLKTRKITQDNGLEECMKLLEANLGIVPRYEDEEEQKPLGASVELDAQISTGERTTVVKDVDEGSDSEDTPESNSISKSKSMVSAATDDTPDPELSDFVILKMLNKGGFGKVFLVKNTIDNKYYAMKRIRKDLLIETGQIENTMNEKTVLLRLQNPFLLGMSYAYQSEFRLYFFLEYISGGDLYDNLVKVKRFQEDQVKFIAAQIAIALGYLHENKIVHRDLKPENVLVKPDGYVVLADFGLAKFLDEKADLAQTMCGTPEYMAPEILKGKPQSYTVDWWTFGVLIYELVTGRSPFKHKNDRKLRKLITRGKFPWPDPEKHKIMLSDEVQDIIKKLLNPDASQRLGAGGVNEIMKHPWFKDINFEDICNRKVKPTYLPVINEIIEENKVLIKSYRKLKKGVKKADKLKDELLET